MNENVSENREIKIIIVSAKELREMDDAARKRDLEAFEKDPSIKMPLSGYTKDRVLHW